MNDFQDSRAENIDVRHKRIVGRGTHVNPANKFEKVRFESDPETNRSPDDVQDNSSDTSGGNLATRIATQYIPDDSQSIVSKNDSPDLNFQYSLNPYRGCSHGCSYCYARTYHEYLGMSAGLDFETKLLYKPRSAELLRKWLNRKSWKCEQITLSGATDCYQGAEREFELTRQCLEVALEFRQPIAIVTKNALVLRDLDLLTEMARLRLTRVNISITTLDQHLTRLMEPRTSSPHARLAAIGELTKNGIPTRALLSPIIPGLTDIEIPTLVEAVKDAGAHSAGSTILRLPGAVEQIFLEWLRRTQPSHADRVESRIRQLRGGNMSDARFGKRMRGEGEMANQIRQTFDLFARKHGLDKPLATLNTELFGRPSDAKQRRLF